MNDPLVDEWAAKADEDWTACQQLLASRPDTVPDVIGYLARQSGQSDSGTPEPLSRLSRPSRAC